MKRALLRIGYFTFALLVPILFINWKFPLATFLDQSTTYQVGVGGFMALLAALVFFRNNLVDWVKGFDRVTWFRGIFKWILYIFPTGFALGIVLVTYNFSEKFLPVLTGVFVSHLIAGVLNVLLEKYKVETFKEWVRK